MSFESLLDRFSAAVAACDAAGFASLFTPDGAYDDYFFGEHRGRDAIAHMLERFHVGGERFRWQFVEPLASDTLGYARYCFSYLSREPESAGALVVFEGTSRFRLSNGLIEHYAETFDRGGAFVQLGYATPRVRKLLDRYAGQFRVSEVVREHVALRRLEGLGDGGWVSPDAGAAPGRGAAG
ncbi:MAG: nuclear transport factor 2 family protein [Burkholderiaceae bacterium]